MDPRWLLRMTRWVQNPPSWQRVVFVLSVVAVCIAVAVAASWTGWPDALTPNDMRRLSR